MSSTSTQNNQTEGSIKESQQPATKTTRTAKVLALSLGSSLSLMASIASGMIASRWLSKHDYATFRQTFLAYDFIAPLLILGLPNALYYFLPREPEVKRGVIIDNIALLVGLGLLFSLFIAVGGYQIMAHRFNNPDLLRTLPSLIPYPLFVMPIAGVSAVLVYADRTKMLAVYNVVSSLILTVSTIIAMLVTSSYQAPVLTRIVIMGLLLPAGLYLMFKVVPGAVRLPNIAGMKGMVSYSVPLGLATMLGSLTLQLDSIIVASICSPDDFAVYVNGAMEIPVIGIITGSITTVVFAEMSAMCAKGNKQAALQLFHKASIKSASILLPTMCFLLVTAHPFITFLYSDRYQASVTPFFVYLWVFPVRIVVYGSALMALGLTRSILVRSIIDLALNALFCFILVKYIGYIGAAISLIITLYLWHVPFNLHAIAKGFGVSWWQSLPFNILAKILLLSMLGMPFAVLGIYFSPSSWPVIELVSASLLYWPFVFFLLYWYKFLVLPVKIERFVPYSLRV